MSEEKILLHSLSEEPLLDRKINGKSWIVKMTIKDYLKITSTTTNHYQRNIQNLSFYRKLIKDLLDDTVMPPISVVYPSVVDFDEGLNIDHKFIILDGLQRTNSIQECMKLLENGESKGKIQTVEEFNNKKIYVEIWEDLDTKYILYKMVVLNTGQKKMDYEHQLDILSESLERILTEENIEFITRKEELENRNKENHYRLSSITAALVSFLSGKPTPGKKNAAEYLFDQFNLSIEENDDDALSLISDDVTYSYLIWVLKDLREMIDEKYGKERNPLKKYDVFLSSLLGSMGYAHAKNPEKFENKIQQLIDLFASEQDPLRLNIFEISYNSFKTGIGQKRRRFIYETFKRFFIMESSVRLEWEEVLDELS